MYLPLNLKFSLEENLVDIKKKLVENYFITLKYDEQILVRSNIFLRHQKATRISHEF